MTIFKYPGLEYGAVTMRENTIKAMLEKWCGGMVEIIEVEPPRMDSFTDKIEVTVKRLDIESTQIYSICQKKRKVKCLRHAV